MEDDVLKGQDATFCLFFSRWRLIRVDPVDLGRGGHTFFSSRRTITFHAFQERPCRQFDTKISMSSIALHFLFVKLCGKMIYIFNNNNNLLTAKEYYIQLPIFVTDNKRAYYKLYFTLMCRFDILNNLF